MSWPAKDLCGSYTPSCNGKTKRGQGKDGQVWLKR